MQQRIELAAPGSEPPQFAMKGTLVVISLVAGSARPRSLVASQVNAAKKLRIHAADFFGKLRQIVGGLLHCVGTGGQPTPLGAMATPLEFPAITDAELTLLKALWDHGPSTVRALHTATPDRAYTTVQTLLLRLEEKGVVRVDRTGLAHVFEAAVSREDLLDRRLHALADELCDGAAAPLLLRLVAGRKVSTADISHFRRLLDAAQREDTP